MNDKKTLSRAPIETAKDTDNDGLKDWEEALWKTNPNKSDTDGDSTTDNDEILAGRDPLKPGPDDMLPKIAADTPNTSASPTEDENLTQKLANDFARTYLQKKSLEAMRASSNPQDTQSLSANTTTGINDVLFGQQLSESIAKIINEEIQKPPKEHFTKDNITLGSSESGDAVRAYINSLGSAIIDTPSIAEGNTAQIFLQAIAEQKLEDIKKLNAHRDTYRYLASQIMNIAVPPSLAETHRSFANSFWELGDITEKMTHFEEDPITGFAALNEYALAAERSIVPVKTIVDTIHTYHLTFNSDEGGALFDQYLTAFTQ